MAERALLITGADGYLGRLLVHRLLTTTDRPLILWTRAASDREAADRCAAAFGAAVVGSSRIHCTGGDLTLPDAFDRVEGRRVGGIAHLAAVTAFTVDADTATAVNVDGTRRLLDLAQRCPDLATVCLAGTLYASGLRAGAVREEQCEERPDFANEYERSKWEAEALLFDRDLPRFSVVRTATVLADDMSGGAGQQNAVHHTLQLLRHGLLSLMPGTPDTPVYLTTGDRAARAIAAAVESGSGVYHEADEVGDCLTLGGALDIAFEVFGRDQRFSRRRIRRPMFTDRRTFDLLAGATSSLGGGILGQAVGSVRPFAAQLYIAKQVHNARLRALLPDREPLDAAALFAATCQALTEPGWDRHGRIA